MKMQEAAKRIRYQKNMFSFASTFSPVSSPPSPTNKHSISSIPVRPNFGDPRPITPRLSSFSNQTIASHFLISSIFTFLSSSSATYRSPMAANATLPVSNQPPIATPAFRAFLTRLSSSVRAGFAQRRPWIELIDRTAMSRPETLSEAISRIRRNYTYFRVNYITLLAAVLAFSLLSNPFSLILLVALVSGWLFLYFFRPSDQPLVILDRTFSEWETLGGLVVLTILVVFLTSVGSLLISAMLIGVAIPCVHGAFRVPEDLFLDEQEGSSATGVGAGFLSSFVGVAGPPPVATSTDSI